MYRNTKNDLKFIEVTNKHHIYSVLLRTNTAWCNRTLHSFPKVGQPQHTLRQNPQQTLFLSLKTWKKQQWCTFVGTWWPCYCYHCTSCFSRDFWTTGGQCMYFCASSQQNVDKIYKTRVHLTHNSHLGTARLGTESLASSFLIFSLTKSEPWLPALPRFQCFDGGGKAETMGASGGVVSRRFTSPPSAFSLGICSFPTRKHNFIQNM